jgi:hypothetical protein
MKKLVIVLGLAVTGLTACNNFEKGEGEMLYKIHTDKPGEKIKEGEKEKRKRKKGKIKKTNISILFLCQSFLVGLGK